MVPSARNSRFGNLPPRMHVCVLKRLCRVRSHSSRALSYMFVSAPFFVNFEFSNDGHLMADLCTMELLEELAAVICMCFCVVTFDAALLAKCIMRCSIGCFAAGPSAAIGDSAASIAFHISLRQQWDLALCDNNGRIIAACNNNHDH